MFQNDRFLLAINEVSDGWRAAQQLEFCFTGDGPYCRQQLAHLIEPPLAYENYDIETHLSDEMRKFRFDQWLERNTPDVVVIGQNGFNETELIAIVDTYAPNVPAFMPQEGFLALLLFKQDWWNDLPAYRLNQALAHHEGLQFVHGLRSTKCEFDWPETIPQPPTSGNTDVTETGSTILKRLGYSIRTDSGKLRSQEDRRKSLARIVFNPEVGLDGAAYVIAWLWERNSAKLTPPKYAMPAWKSDLAWLKTTFFDKGQPKFRWPM